MLNVNGIVRVAEPPQLREFETNKGVVLEFDVLARDSAPDSRQMLHRYRASMWVPKEEQAKWVAELNAADRLWIVENAHWRMKERPGLAHPIPELHLDRRQFVIADKGHREWLVGRTEPKATMPSGAKTNLSKLPF